MLVLSLRLGLELGFLNKISHYDVLIVESFQSLIIVCVTPNIYLNNILKNIFWILTH